MKKVIEPATNETAVYYSDFSGICFDHFGPNAELTFEFNYGSKYDSGTVKLHLSDEEAEQVLSFIKTKLTKDCMNTFKRLLKEETNKNDRESISSRNLLNLLVN